MVIQTSLVRAETDSFESYLDWRQDTSLGDWWSVGSERKEQ